MYIYIYILIPPLSSKQLARLANLRYPRLSGTPVQLKAHVRLVGFELRIILAKENAAAQPSVVVFLVAGN